MINNRNGFTSAAFVTVLVSAFIIFSAVDDSIQQFRYMVIILASVGCFGTVFYLVVIQEKKLTNECIELEEAYQEQAHKDL